MIISLHIYKTAGTSFRDDLQKHLGNNVLCDYKSDFNQINELFYGNEQIQSPNADPVENIKIIHGHFIVSKWLRSYPIESNSYITWVRHPLLRMMSHYKYIQSIFNEEQYGKYDWSKIVRDRWSFEDFCFYDRHRNFMTKMLCGIPYTAFDFIGITENYDEDCLLFFNYFFPNINHVIPSRSNQSKIKTSMDSLFELDFIKEFEKFHSLDYELFNYAKSKYWLK